MSTARLKISSDWAHMSSEYAICNASFSGRRNGVERGMVRALFSHDGGPSAYRRVARYQWAKKRGLSMPSSPRQMRVRVLPFQKINPTCVPHSSSKLLLVIDVRPASSPTFVSVRLCPRIRSNIFVDALELCIEDRARNFRGSKIQPGELFIRAMLFRIPIIRTTIGGD